jgi:CRP/FNR family transcriptional regulator
MTIDASRRAALLAKTPLGGEGKGAREIAGLLVERRVREGETVFSERDEGGPFFIVGTGRLRVFRILPNGREITVFLLGPEATFGFLPLLDGGPYPVSVRAVEASTLLVLDRGPFLRLLRADAEIGVRLLANLAGRLRGCMDQLSVLGQPGARARAAYGLLGLVPAGAEGEREATARLPFRQEELARLLHLTPESLSRALAKLRQDGLVERLGPGRFRIPSLDALRRAADGE